MLRKKFTFLLVPDSQGPLKQIRVSIGLFYALVVVIVAALISGVLFSSQYFTDRVAEAELDRLRAENSELSRKFENLRWDLAEVESRYEELVQKEVALRTYFDLPEIDFDQRQLGVGGPEPAEMALMSDAETTAYYTELEVDRLLTLSRFEIEKYREVEDDLLTLRDRLEHTPSIWPTRGWLSSFYGRRPDPFTGMPSMHHGLDIANRNGTPVIAPADGRIESVSKHAGLGRMLTINHGYGFKTRYGHLSKLLVKRGQEIKRGDVIALMGASGHSTGPHLHYEVWRNGRSLDPLNYILNDM
jgi:murein DD-endopeptidase MepM/ murein hydrolase activator NlpD